MAIPKVYAVLTGDIVDSSRIGKDQRKKLLADLKSSFFNADKILNSSNLIAPFSIYRGDSFQGVLANPEDALLASLIIRATLRKSVDVGLKDLWDARIAVGLGEIAYLSETGAEGDGIAYRRSGPILDQMTGDMWLQIKTPWEEVDQELAVACPLADIIIQKWSSAQAEVVLLQIEGLTQQAMADKLHITQAAVNQRLKGAGWFAIDNFLKRFKSLIIQKLAQ